MPNNSSLICPLLKRLLCLNCRNLDDFSLLYKTQIKLRYDINPNVLDIKFAYSNNNKKVVYKKLFIDALIRYRNRMKWNILNKLKKYFNHNHEIISITENIDTKTIGILNGDYVNANYDTTIKKQSYLHIFDFICADAENKISFKDLVKLINSEFE